MSQNKKGWHREDIKAAVRKRGTTMRAIAIDAGLCKDACHIAMTTPFPAAQHAIAKFLGVSLHSLWPAWYDKQGQRIGTRTARKARTISRQTQSQKLNARGAA